MKALLPLLLLVFAFCASARAHDEPTSFIDLHLSPNGMDLAVTASVTDLSHSLTDVEPGMLFQPEVLKAKETILAGLIIEKLKITGPDNPLPLKFLNIQPIPEKRDLRLVFRSEWKVPPSSLLVQCQLFPYDVRHRTFLNIYENDQLLRQEIFEGNSAAISFLPGSRQSISAVVGKFIQEGIHHIFIGPDHILFIVGLMLLGGKMGRLLKIVTAFTIAHSITLGLATFHILNPPASLIEPAIALSIVSVGIYTFIGSRRHDPRLALAFCFGLIHGFGFAYALEEMQLPQHALGWSLFAYNSGVEIGQCLIVLAVVPLLAQLKKLSLLAWERTISAGALIVTSAGSFWFFQRVMS